MDKKRSLYRPPPTPPVEYEMTTLPLQEQVATARKAVCSIWAKGEAQWERLETSVAGYVGAARTKTRDALVSVGIQDTTRAMQGVSVGGAAIVGYIAARKKSSFRRVLYPTLAAGVVWGLFYLREGKRRAQLWEAAQHNSWLQDYLPGSWGGSKPAAGKLR